MPEPLKVLIVEDNPDDAAMVLRELRRAGFEPQWRRVETEESYLQALKPELDIILSDHVLPQFSGPRALELLKEQQLHVPFIVISGTIGEEMAVQAIKQGAADYLLKDRLGRLGPAIRQALEQCRAKAEREQTLLQLRESNERFRQVVENIGEVIWMSEPSTQRIIYISPGYERIWGGDPEELYANPRRWFEAILPEDQPNVLAALPSQMEGRYDVEYRIRRPDGTVRQIHDRAFPVREGESPVYRVAGIAEDITNRKLAEERLQQQAAMLDLAHDAIIVREVATEKITYWNKGAEKAFGWTATEALGKPIGELICLDPEFPKQITAAVIAKGEWVGENQQLTKDGRKLKVSVRATPIRDADGTVTAILSINADVTEQRKLEAQYLRAQRMESIGTLASGVAHDLNNILAPIMMSVPLLRSDLPPQMRENIIALVETSAQRGAQIIKQVLAFGRGLEGERKPLSMCASIAELEKIMRETFPRLIRIEADIALDTWPVLGDATQIHQILLNLCVNARDAMPQGGRLRLSTRNQAIDENYAAMLSDVSPGRYVIVEVADEGTGIPPEILERIFDPFFTTKGVGQGTGLGLSTVLGIVKSHGGSVHVNSVPGKGTTIQIYLPAAVETTIAIPELAGSLETLPRGHGELILVVDDEPAILNAAKSVLGCQGYETLCAHDGTEGLALFAQHLERVAAVLTDLMMPYMDGVSLIRAVRRMRPEIPVTASTGLGERAHLEELKALGITSLLHKPYGAAELLRAVAAMVQSK